MNGVRFSCVQIKTLAKLMEAARPKPTQRDYYPAYEQWRKGVAVFTDLLGEFNGTSYAEMFRLRCNTNSLPAQPKQDEKKIEVVVHINGQVAA